MLFKQPKRKKCENISLILKKFFKRQNPEVIKKYAFEIIVSKMKLLLNAKNLFNTLMERFSQVMYFQLPMIPLSCISQFRNQFLLSVLL